MPGQGKQIHLTVSIESPTLDEILTVVKTIQGDVKAMSKEMDDLEAQVAQNTTVIGSAKTLIQGFAAQLAAAGQDPVKLAALKSSLQVADDDLAAAVAANTPAAPPTP